MVKQSHASRCQLYIAKESISSFTYSIIAQKNTSILPAINARVLSVMESGLYSHWMQQGISNGTICDYSPSTVTVHQPFSLASLWWAPRLNPPLAPQAVFAVLGVGLASGFLVFLLEVTVCRSASPSAAFPLVCCKRR
ncbi:hypothetical protein O3P69_002403 [Scylla paramamosain]|uniref:Uncharacterized protein n=1 Tax=Scylla paramamosain TaxID=85552 RepID=A0AAW0V6W8_SCYPA